MLSFLRAAHPPRTNSATHNPIIYEDGRSSVEFRAANSDYTMIHTLPPTTKEHGVSIIQPPFHYHIYQKEFFRVRSGTAVLFKGTNPKPFITLSTEEDAPKTATVPSKTYHRFENPSPDEKLVIDIHLAPEDYENEQRFFRNFFGYLNDCKNAKVAPSLFQLMVFLHSADTPLALPVPFHGLGVLLSRMFLIGVATWGRWVLGYQTNYSEYYQEKKTR